MTRFKQDFQTFSCPAVCKWFSSPTSVLPAAAPLPALGRPLAVHLRVVAATTAQVALTARLCDGIGDAGSVDGIRVGGLLAR